MKTSGAMRTRWLRASLKAVLFGSLAFTRLELLASSPWVLVDDFQYLSSAAATGVAQDAAGNIYVVGWGVSNSVQRALTRKSSDGGATWTIVDDFLYPAGSSSRFLKVSADAFGNLFAVGESYDSGGKEHWLVRRSQDGGTTWATVDDYLGPGNGTGGGAWPNGVLVLNSGQVFVVGYGGTAVSSGKKVGYAQDWVVRTSLDGGTTWTTVDDYEFAPGAANGVSQAQAITSSGAGLFVVGWAQGGYWIVRRSPTGSTGSWSTVDVSTNSGMALTAGVDANGYVYAGGFYHVACKNSSYSHWLVRRSTDGGQTWATVDDLPGTLCGGGPSAAGFTLDAYNNIVMVGRDINSNGIFWLTRSSFGTPTSPTGSPGTWVTTDEYEYSSPNGSDATDICRDSTGNLFAVGYSTDSTNHPQRWLVRKQAP